MAACKTCGKAAGMFSEICSNCFQDYYKGQASSSTTQTTDAKPSAASVSGTNPLSFRYASAYRVSDLLVSASDVIGSVGISISVIVALAGFGTCAAVGDKSMIANNLGPVSSIPFFILSALVLAASYVTKLLVSALGQIHRAVLDTAVNTSPFISDDERATMLGISQAVQHANREAA